MTAESDRIMRDDWMNRAPAMLRNLEGPDDEPLATHFDRRWLWRIETFLAVNGTTFAHRQMAWDLRDYLHKTCEHVLRDVSGWGGSPEGTTQCLWCNSVYSPGLPPAAEGDRPGHRGGGERRSEQVSTCDPTTCLCCVCCLRRSEEFGAAFTAADECCPGCHDEMAVPEWPGHRCPDMPAAEVADVTTGGK